jgi:eukaryotic-like serine/threonine-protein kinase
MNEADAALLGRKIAGKFVIEKYLGGGAMGAVYRARQTALDKNVAVKVMHQGLDTQFAARFHREAKAASRLDHPNSMRVIDFGEEPDGLLYIAMEYLEGRDLYRLIHEDWPLSNERIVALLSQALAAIAVAHDMGVIHRDLKPENIMVLEGKDDEGKAVDVVKVCDFGIAKIQEQDEDGQRKSGGQKLTTQGLVIGTPEYMSPEQGRGEKLDARSDLYSVGIILYQLLTGRTPFEADSPLATVLKHVSEPPAPPQTIFPGVHRGLEVVCLRALAKNREERYQSARDMRAAMRAALAGEAPEVLASMAPSAPPPIHSAPTVAGNPIAASGQPQQAASRTAPLGGPDAGKVTPLGAEAAPAAQGRGGGRALLVGGALALVGVGALGGVVVALRTPSPVTVIAAPPTVAPSEAPSASDSAAIELPATPPTGAPTESAAPSDSAAPTDTSPRAPHKAVHGAPPKSLERSPEPAPTSPPEPAPPEPAPTAPPAAPPTKAPEAPAPPPAPAFNPSRCVARAGAAKSNGAVAAKDFHPGDLSNAYTQCFRQSLSARPGGPIQATVQVRFDDNGRFRGATCAACPPAARRCVEAGSSHARVTFRGGDVTGQPAFDVPVTFACP